MFRFLVRFCGLMLLAGAFAAAVVDGARSLADQRVELTSMGRALDYAFPSKFPLLQPFVEQRLRQPLLWDPVLLDILSAPAFVVLALLGLILFYLVRRRPPAIGASSRGR